MNRSHGADPSRAYTCVGVTPVPNRSDGNGFHPSHAHARVGAISESSTSETPDQTTALQQWLDMQSWQTRSRQPRHSLEWEANR
jgi:hypothetical protein